jgi:hypothetical protein
MISNYEESKQHDNVYNQHENRTRYHPIQPLSYSQKPEIGSYGSNQNDNKLLIPLQVAYPNGGFGIGISALKLKQDEMNDGRLHDTAVIISGPENTTSDIYERKSLATAFILLALINFIITILLFVRADKVDTSKVETYHRNTPTVFGKVSSHRTPIEKLNFSFIIITLFEGVLSCYFESALGLSAYATSVLLNIILGTASLPYFVYSFRYIFDFAMLYIALVYRAKLAYTILPTHIHRQ